MTPISKNNDLINLKEAAALSGYSADYIGQLIRKGKLPGKQVYSHVAWMTTRDAVLAYLEDERSAQEMSLPHDSLGERLVAFQSTRAFRVIAYGIIVLAIAICLVSFYMLSVLADASWRKHADAELEASALHVSVESAQPSLNQ